MNKRTIAVLLFITYSLVFTASLYAYFTREELRGRGPRTFRRSAELTWTYETVTWEPPGRPKESFSYLKQDYILGLYGPLLSPTLGLMKLDLSYRVGKNILTPTWVSKTRQQMYTYSASFLLAPPFLNRFTDLTLNLSRVTNEDFDELKSPVRTYLNTGQSVSINFRIPGQINLSRRGSRRVGRDRNNFFTFSFPRVNFFYSKSNAVDEIFDQPQFNRDRYLQRMRVDYNFHRLRLEYRTETTKNINLLTDSIIDSQANRYFGASIYGNEFWGIFQGVSFTANYNQYEPIHPPGILLETTNASLVLTTKQVSLLGLVSSINNSNSFIHRKPSETWEVTNSLSLNSYAYLLPIVYLSNSTGYSIFSGNGRTYRQSLNESLSLAATPWRRLGFAAGLTQIYTFDHTKKLDENYYGEVHFTPFSILDSRARYGINQSKDLLSKNLTQDTVTQTLNLSSSISPLSYIYKIFFNSNNNNHNHRNSRGWLNGNGNLLNLSLGFTFERVEDRLKNEVSTYFAETYNLKSTPFGAGRLTLEFGLTRTQTRAAGQPVTTVQYYTTTITSEAGYAYRGLTFNVQASTYDLKQINLSIYASYAVGQSKITLGSRIIAYSLSGPFHALSLSFNRKL